MDPPLQDRIVRLNVGGTLFMTTESTLTWPGPESFFVTLLSGRIPSRTDESGLRCQKYKPVNYKAKFIYFQAPSSSTATRACLA